MSKPKVLVTNHEVPEVVLDKLRKKCEVICPEVCFANRQELLDKVKGVDAIFWFSHGRVDDEVLDAAGPQLQVVSTMSAGFDHIDVPALKARGIKVGHTPRVLSVSVAETAVALCLMAGRRLQEGRKKIERGEWITLSPAWMLGHGLDGAVVGIVGLGDIGVETAKRMKAFDISSLLYTGHQPKPQAEGLGAKFVSFDTLLEESDFVILSCPLNNQTKNMMNESTFSKMKKNAILVNIGRGGLVDQDALIKALTSGQIFAAGLDVTVPEPLPTDHPLLSLDNCVIIPHLGSATVKTRIAMGNLAAENILAVLEGKEMQAPL